MIRSPYLFLDTDTTRNAMYIPGRSAMIFLSSTLSRFPWVSLLTLSYHGTSVTIQFYRGVPRHSKNALQKSSNSGECYLTLQHYIIVFIFIIRLMQVPHESCKSVPDKQCIEESIPTFSFLHFKFNSNPLRNHQLLLTLKING